jgi:NhaA family Na+:H+ antiporter
LGIVKLPKDLTWKHIAGVSLLAGIGFTMSIFITLLAFNNKAIIDTGKIAIIFASTLSAVAGLITLKLVLQPKKINPKD